MLIDDHNAYQGNQTMAWVLLLYYHLLREGGITHNQTVYVDSGQFNAFDYVAVSVAQNLENDIDQRLIRQGAVIYLLCELNDMVIDYETDYLEQPYTKRVLSALSSESALAAVPEVSEILQVVSAVQATLDYSAFRSMLRQIFSTYVFHEFKALTSEARQRSNLHIIYTESEMLLSKKQYESWREIQDEYPDYKASLGPWDVEETEDYLKCEYPKIYPSASEQLRSFIESANTIHVVTFA
jgi:hypothetical protein